MRKILIGIDGTSRGEDALILGRVLADAVEDPQVVVATVYPAAGPPSEGEDPVRHEAEQKLARARELWPELDAASFQPLRGGSPSAGLHRLAADEDFDVIVLGTSHREGIGRIFAGSATEQTLQGSPCAVAVAPPGYAHAASGNAFALRRVGVAFDGSPEAVHALDLLPDLVRPDVTVVAIDVVDTVGAPATAGYGYGTFVREVRDNSARILADARTALADRRIEQVETEQPEGSAARELIEASKRLDLLVLGSRAHGPALRLLLGSVSAHVVRAAACPVLIYPRSAAPEQQQ